MNFLPAMGVANPFVLAGLLALPVIWWLLRFTPPRPRRQAFPPTRILAELMRRDETRARLIATAAQFDVVAASDQEAETPAAEPEDLDIALARIVSASQQAASDAASQAVWVAPEGGDDLTLIRGIGPAFASQLADAGLVSFADLATSSPEALQAIIAAPDWRHPDYQDWIEQAQPLADDTSG